MFFWEEKTKIIIWGTGELGKKLYQKYKNLFKVEYFIDNNSHDDDDYLYEKKILQFSLQNISKYKILIASSFWKEISIQLIECGMKLYENFCPYWMFEYNSIDYFKLYEIAKEDAINLVDIMIKNKKIALIHGNCQTTLIQSYLEKNLTFNERYIFLNIPRVCIKTSNWDLILKSGKLLEKCSLLITQNIAPNNRFSSELATNNICSKLSDKCKVVRITNMYFDGYFPQLKKNEHNIMIDLHQSGLFPFGDKYVDKLFSCGYNLNEIIEKLLDEHYLKKNMIIKMAEKSFKKLEIKEKECDIKMLDYIKKYYKENQLFYSPNHPSNFLIKECVIRILKYLDINDLEFENEEIFKIDMNSSLRGQDIVIYPSVIKALEIKQCEKIYFPNRYLIRNYYFNFNDFIKEYIINCLYKEND